LSALAGNFGLPSKILKPLSKESGFFILLKTIPISCSLSANDANNNDRNNIEICTHFLFVIGQRCIYNIGNASKWSENFILFLFP